MSKTRLPLNKLTCGNCGEYVPGIKSCGLGLGKREAEGYGCCVGLSCFKDRGVTRQFNLTVGETELRTVTIPKLLSKGLPDPLLNKIKLGLECPNEFSRYLLPLGDFNFALAKEVLKSEELANYYKLSTRVCYLDNSTNEELKPCSIKELKKASTLINPKFVISPDYLGDSTKTLSSLPEAIDAFGKDGLIPVVQGSSLEEVVNCGRSIFGSDFRRVAVPYDLILGRHASVCDMARVRSIVVYFLAEMGFTNIHLLGLTSIEEFIYYWYDRPTRIAIESVDTGGPVLLGLKGLEYPNELSFKTTPTLRLMEENTSKDFSNNAGLSKAVWNIAFLRTLL
jgi:hypothetical protein